MSRAGRCMCGAVSFEAAAVPDHFGVCHCEMCRRWAGSALFGVTIKAGDLAIVGQEHVRTIQSSAWAERAWCDRCGSGLWYRITQEGGPGFGNYEVARGRFDEPSGNPQTPEILIDEKPDGYTIEGNHKRLTRVEVMKLYGVDLD